MNETSSPGLQTLVGAAARKGVTLDVRLMPAGFNSAEEVAAAVGVDLGQIVTSLVFVAPRRDGRPVTIVCLVSGRNHVDLGYLAAVTGEVDLRRATERETLELTGYSVGTVPPFGHGRNVATVMDQELAQYEWVWAAAGSVGAQFRVAPQTLRTLCNAMVAPVAATSWRRSSAAHQDEPGLQFGGGARA